MAKIQNTGPGQIDLSSMPTKGKERIEVSVPPATVGDAGPVNGVLELTDEALAALLEHPFTKAHIESGLLVIGEVATAAAAAPSEPDPAPAAAPSAPAGEPQAGDASQPAAGAPAADASKAKAKAKT